VPGLIVTALAIPVMYLLARRKLAVAAQLGSRALRADAVEAVACGWLSFVVVEGREAWAGESAAGTISPDLVEISSMTMMLVLTVGASVMSRKP
jgi:hypothetical protein